MKANNAGIFLDSRRSWTNEWMAKKKTCAKLSFSELEMMKMEKKRS